MTQFFRKICLSLYLKGIWKGYWRFYCKRELETEQNCNILTPTLMAITAFLSRSPGLLNRGPGGPASLGHGLHPSIFSPTGLNFNSSIGGPEGPLCWMLVFSTAPYLQLPDFLCSPGLYNCSTSTFFLWVSQIALIQPIHGQDYILIFLDWMSLLFTLVHFLFWQLGNMLQKDKCTW